MKRVPRGRIGGQMLKLTIPTVVVGLQKIYLRGSVIHGNNSTIGIGEKLKFKTRPQLVLSAYII
jgi:hypothetical protein